MRLDEGAGYSRAGFVMVVSHNAGSWTSIIWMNGQCSSLLSQLPSPHIKRLLVFYFTEFNSFDYFSPPCSHLILFSFAQLTFWVNLFSFFFFWSLCFPFYFPIIHAVVFSSYLFFVKLLHIYVLIFYFLWHVNVLFSTFSLLGNVFLFSF